MGLGLYKALVLEDGLSLGDLRLFMKMTEHLSDNTYVDIRPGDETQDQLLICRWEEPKQPQPNQTKGDNQMKKIVVFLLIIAALVLVMIDDSEGSEIPWVKYHVTTQADEAPVFTPADPPVYVEDAPVYTPADPPVYVTPTEDPTTWTVPELPNCNEVNNVDPCTWTGPTDTLPALPSCDEVVGDEPCNWWTEVQNAGT